MTSPPTENGHGNTYTTSREDIQKPGTTGADCSGWSLKIGNPSGPFQFLRDSRSWMIESKMISSKNRHPCWHSTADSIRSLAKRKNVALK